MALLRLISSAIAWTVGIAATIGFTLLGLTASAIPGVRIAPHRLARMWGRTCVAAAGCRVRVDGLDRFDPAARYVVMANHQSALDIPLLIGTIPARWRTVFWAKQSLFRIPVLGHAMRMLGHMPIDRTDRSSAGRMLAASVALAGDRRSVLVFPEETYGPGDDLLPFQRGGFVFAIKTGMPLLPVGVHGTAAALPPGARLVRPFTLSLRFGDPIETRDLSVRDRRALTDRTRAAIEQLRAPTRA